MADARPNAAALHITLGGSWIGYSETSIDAIAGIVA